jgi:hypothetical protein
MIASERWFLALPVAFAFLLPNAAWGQQSGAKPIERESVGYRLPLALNYAIPLTIGAVGVSRLGWAALIVEPAVLIAPPIVHSWNGQFAKGGVSFVANVLFGFLGGLAAHAMAPQKECGGVNRRMTEGASTTTEPASCSPIPIQRG